MKKTKLTRFDQLMMAVTFAEAGIDAPAIVTAKETAGKKRTPVVRTEKPRVLANARG